MFTGLFSTTIWLNGTSVLAILYAIYLCCKSDNKLISGNNVTPISFLIVTITTIYIGTRPITSYADTHLYTTMFNLVKNGYWAELPNAATEPFWTTIEYFCIETTDASVWLLVVASFYVVCMSIAAYRWLPKHFLIAIVFLFTAFSFWGYATNGIRNGMASSIAMLGLSFFMRTKKEMIIGYGLLILAVLTHKSMILTFASATAALYLRNTKVNITFWLFCIVLGLIFQEQFKSLFAGLIDDGRMAHYLSQDVDREKVINTDFRWDFLLYSSPPIIIGWYAISKQNIIDKTYAFLLHTYIFSNAFWILINTAAYSNRFAYLSWFLYPIVLVYPFCKSKFIQNQSIILGLLLIGMVAFTYFM